MVGTCDSSAVDPDGQVGALDELLDANRLFLIGNPRLGT
jgi:hypothetical protein